MHAFSVKWGEEMAGKRLGATLRGLSKVRVLNEPDPLQIL